MSFDICMYRIHQDVALSQLADTTCFCYIMDVVRQTDNFRYGLWLDFLGWKELIDIDKHVILPLEYIVLRNVNETVEIAYNSYEIQIYMLACAQV